MITAVGAEAGQNVNAGQMVVKLARPDDKDGVFNIAETAFTDIGDAHPEVVVWPLSNPDLTVEGVVREISPVADPATRTYTVKVTLKNPPPQLRFGMSIGGRLKGQAALAVALPLSALFEKNGSPAVWVLDQQSSSLTLRPITVARYEANTVVVGSGLAKGDIVVTAGVNTLTVGQKVRLAEATLAGSEQQMKTFNLSRWALEHKSFVVYLMLVVALAGIFEYRRLGRDEDPPFTIKTMVVKTLWPGATTLETMQQVTDRIEKKLEELPNIDYQKSYTKPGESVVFVYLKDSTRASDVPDLWYQVRKKVGDIKQTLPQGVQGPFFNDEFGDTYALIFALTSDGFSHRELRDYAERVRAELLSVPDVAKIDLLGTQDEKIYLEFSTQQLAAMGLDISELIQILQAQNAIQPSGTVDSDAEKIAIRVSGQFTSEESLKAINFRFNGRFFRLSDIAKVQRGYADPQQPIFRYNGRSAIGLAVSMRKNGDVLAFGEHLKERLAKVTADLPAGIESHLVANQPEVVEEAVGEFIKTLIEAIVIVLAVSFLSLGWRPGIVVAIAIPLVLAITFVAMKLAGVSLQRISLGALIIGLGLLVDDAMIAVEMMIKKLEEGCDKITAATFAYTSTAFPMLTGTLVTIAGFVPVGFAASSAGEYTFTLFAVVGIALVASWFVAVLFTPLTGVFILPDKMKGHGHEPSRFARAFHAVLDRVLHLRYWVIGATVALFVAALAGMQFVQQQFFPSSDRPELLVDLTLPQGSSINATRKVVDDLEKILKTDPDIEHWSFYVGSGAIRFYLPLDQQLANDFFAQGVIVTKGFKVRPAVQERILAALQRPEFEQVQPRVSPLELGPPVGWPLKFRISGPDPMKVREIAQNFASLLGKTPTCAEHQLRLERAVQGGPRRGRSGPGSGAGHQFASIEPDHQCCLIGHDRYPGARRYLFDRHRRPRHSRRARQAGDPAQPDDQRVWRALGAA